MQNILPEARPSVLNPELTRPDWTIDTNRPAGVLWLDKNENTDPELMNYTSRLLSEIPPSALATYPDCAPLYRKIADLNSLEANQLILAAGSDGVIRSLYEAFIRPGDQIILTSPTFAMYPIYARMYGAEVIPLEYRPGEIGPNLPLETVLNAVRVPGCCVYQIRTVQRERYSILNH